MPWEHVAEASRTAQASLPRHEGCGRSDRPMVRRSNLTCRELNGSLHTSFHASGEWHTTFSQDAF
jgi:hypothetical protein